MERQQAVLIGGVALLGTMALTALILRATGGVLIYTLDDPYIHLAVAEEILRGGYGINTGEPAAPSSSILYPFLLALAAPLGSWAPLVWGLVGQGMMALAMGVALGPSLNRFALTARVLLALIAALALNALALPLTGMEHTLHAGVSALAVVGLWRTARDGRVPLWLIPVLVLAPALRFEGFALAGLAALALLAGGYRRQGGTVLALIIALGGMFVAAMLMMDLPPLPSSVMVKSQISAEAVGQDGRGALIALIVNAIQNMTTPQGAVLALIAVILLGRAVSDAAMRLVAVPAALAIMAHLVLGRFGWFARYEIYAVAIALTALALCFRSRPWVPVLAMLPFAGSYLSPVFQTPAAALAVHQQHHQMHRLATQIFPRPVAVNDLGYVAWRNPARVIDLWGLGSEEARRLTALSGRTPAVLEQLTAGQADWAMIYDPAFPQGVPQHWCRVAVLETSLGALAWDSVSIYAIDPLAQGPLRAAVRDWAPTVPGGAMVSVFDCP